MEGYQIKTKASIRFNQDNEIPFLADMRLWEGMPDDIDFYPTKILSNGVIVFIGDGYGIRPEHKLAGVYGRGSIGIFSTEIPELVDWCKNNLYNK